MATIEIDGTKYVVADPVAELLYTVSQERDDLAGTIEFYKMSISQEGITCH